MSERTGAYRCFPLTGHQPQGNTLVHPLSIGNNQASEYGKMFEFRGAPRNGEQQLPPTMLQRPGLCGFMFQYQGNDDHHVACVSTGHMFQDLPYVPGMPTGFGLCPYYAVITFSDDGGRQWKWTLQDRELPLGTLFGEGISVNSDSMTSHGDFPADSDMDNYVVALVGFGFRFSGDHHLKRMAILYQENRIFYGFSDDSGNESWNSRIDIAWIPKQYVKTTGEIHGSSPGGYASGAIDVAKPVLRGFEFNFRNGDHHIKEIGVVLPPGHSGVAFRDDNGDDPFDWTIQYADLI